MFLRKKLTRAPSKQLKADIKLDFDCKSEDICNCYNVEVRGKGIRSRFYRKELAMDGRPTQVLASIGAYEYVMTDAGLFRTSDSIAILLSTKTTTSACSCNYRDGIIVSGKNYGTYFVSGFSVTQISDKEFTSVTTCRDRVFGLSGNEVSYTEAGTSNGWKNGQTITLASSCDAIAALDDKVYVLGRTCYVISPDAEDTDFKLTTLATNIGTVAKGTVVNYNGSVYFASWQGLHKIHSNKITPIFTELNDHFEMRYGAAAWFDGKYYLSSICKNSIDEYNDVTLCLDVNEEEVCGVFLGGFTSLGSTPLAMFGISNGVAAWLYYSKTKDGTYVKSNIDFGSEAKKFLDTLTIKTLKDVTVTIRSENETRIYNVLGENFVQKIKIRGMGWRFSIELQSLDGLNVEKLQLEAHVCEEV